MLLMTGFAFSSMKAGALSGEQPLEHINGGVRGAGTDAPRFGDVGDKEGFAAGFGKRRRNRLDAHAVAIGLDHRAAFDGKRLPRERAPICLDRGEIDGQRAAGFVLRVGRL